MTSGTDGFRALGRQGLLTTIGSSTNVDRFLQEVCARSSPVELHFEPNDGPMITCHCRLVMVVGDTILTSRPIYSDAADTIPIGAPIVVHVSMAGARYQFDTLVEGNFAGMDDCRDDPKVGLALRKPDVVDDARRRSNLRISVAAMAPVDVMMVSPAPGMQTACRVDSARIHGRLLDISIGGVSVQIDQKLLHGGGRIERVYLTFRLPGETEEFCMLGSLRHAQLVDRSEALRVGYRIQPWCKETSDRDQKRLARFIERHASASTD